MMTCKDWTSSKFCHSFHVSIINICCYFQSWCWDVLRFKQYIIVMQRKNEIKLLSFKKIHVETLPQKWFSHSFSGEWMCIKSKPLLQKNNLINTKTYLKASSNVSDFILSLLAAGSAKVFYIYKCSLVSPNLKSSTTCFSKQIETYPIYFWRSQSRTVASVQTWSRQITRVVFYDRLQNRLKILISTLSSFQN